jgi:hypothetical protein
MNIHHSLPRPVQFAASFKPSPTVEQWLKDELQKGNCYPFFFIGGKLGNVTRNPSIRYYEGRDLAQSIEKTIQVLSKLPGVTILEANPQTPLERQFTLTRNDVTTTWDIGSVEPHNLQS